MIEIRQTLDANSFITWNTPQGIVTNTRKINVQKDGKYFVSVSSANSTKVVKDSCFVRISYRLKPLIKDTTICKGRSISLDARYSGLKYQWSTGENTQKIRIENAGKYWVKIRNGSCVTVDSVRVRALPGLSVVVPNEITFCANEEKKIVIAKGPSNVRYSWNTGATTASVQINKEGVYWLRSESPQCGKVLDTVKVKIKMCECEMIIPNSFSPNEDNRNDYFLPVSTCEYSYYNITITDRWGNTVFSSNNIAAKWDGRFKGNLCPEDIYLYHIESTEKNGDKKLVRNGKISLFR